MPQDGYIVSFEDINAEIKKVPTMKTCQIKPMFINPHCVFHHQVKGMIKVANNKHSALREPDQQSTRDNNGSGCLSESIAI